MCSVVWAAFWWNGHGGGARRGNETQAALLLLLDASERSSAERFAMPESSSVRAERFKTVRAAVFVCALSREVCHGCNGDFLDEFGHLHSSCRKSHSARVYSRFFLALWR